MIAASFAYLGAAMPRQEPQTTDVGIELIRGGEGSAQAIVIESISAHIFRDALPDLKLRLQEIGRNGLLVAKCREVGKAKFGIIDFCGGIFSP